MNKSGMKKLIKNIMIVASIVLLCYSVKGITVFASQGPVYDFCLSLGSSVSFDDTELVTKTSADACSMKCTWAEQENTCYYAFACNYDGNYSLNTELFYEGTWALLNNTVYENGFRKVMITAYVNGTCGVSDEHGALFSGYWYADSGFY